MAQKYNSRDGETIFDIATATGAGLENLVSIAISSGISSLNSSISANTEIVYTVPDPVSYDSESTSNDSDLKYYARDGQTIYDIALMLNGTLENIIDLINNSSLQSINDTVNFKSTFNYTDSNLSIVSWVKKNEYVFKTGFITQQSNVTFYILTEASFILNTELGDKLTIE
jgi:hypothetical protein